MAQLERGCVGRAVGKWETTWSKEEWTHREQDSPCWGSRESWRGKELPLRALLSQGRLPCAQAILLPSEVEVC